MAVASLVLGIIGLPLSFAFIGIIPCLIGLILGIVAINALRKQRKSIGVAVGGVVCSSIGLFVALIMLVTYPIRVINTATPVNEPAQNNTQSYAAPVNSVWASGYTDISEFDYSTNGNELYIKRHKGKSKKIRVASAYVIDGKTYHTVAFQDVTFFCDNIESCIIPEGTRSLEMATFNSCGVKFLYLPSTLTSVDTGFWQYFHGVEKLYYGGTREQWEKLLNVDRGKLDVKEVVFEQDPELLK